MIPGNPLIWAAVLGWLVAAGGYGTMKVLEARRVQASYDKGVSAGKESVATVAVAEAKKAADDFREAEAETPIDADREYFMRLCAKHSSCALRAKYRGIYGGGS